MQSLKNTQKQMLNALKIGKLHKNTYKLLNVPQNKIELQFPI